MGSLASDTTGQLHFHFHFSLSCAGEGNGNPLQCLELITSSITLNLYLGALFISGFGFGRL